MKIALFSTYFTEENIQIIRDIHRYLDRDGHQVHLIQSLEKYLRSNYQKYDYFEPQPFVDSDYDFLFSIGGDGNLLDSVTIVGPTEVPILGINTGRLGFLTSTSKEFYKSGLDLLVNEKFSTVKRTLLEVEITPYISAIKDLKFALNEVCVTRKNDVSMLQIDAALNGEKLTTYWGDGLIICTPTGSTGYSLSVGGPIVSPENSCWVLNPIAPHNINVRPLVIPDSNTMQLNISGRGTHHLLSLDSRSISLEYGHLVTVRKARFSINTVQLQGNSFFRTLQEKLYWGKDTRNSEQ